MEANCLKHEIDIFPVSLTQTRLKFIFILNMTNSPKYLLKETNNVNPNIGNVQDTADKHHYMLNLSKWNIQMMPYNLVLYFSDPVLD